MNWLPALLFLVTAPVIGGLVAGVDRRITARMQGRIGPPILQPFYDVGKLFEKEQTVVAPPQNAFILSYLILIAASGALFFAGGDLLLVIFAFTLSHVFLILGAYVTHSPFSHIGAERELILLMAYEPMVILSAVGLYLVTGSFFVIDIATSTTPAILFLPGVFFGFLTVLTMKLRKSPFDISTSHHAHQELVKGITTEFTGPSLGRIEVAHWYETVFLLGFIYLFFGFSPLIAVVAIAVSYIGEILLDNTITRLKWQFVLESGWVAALSFGFINLLAVYYMGGLIL